MSIAGAQACSFFDDDPTSPTFGVVVQFNRITENSSFYTKGVGEKDFRGNMIYAGDESRLEIEAFDYTGKLAQLKEWQKNKTPLKFVLAGVQENILWYEETTIEVEEPKSFATKTRNVIKVRMEADGGEHKIWSGINILHGALVLAGHADGWSDADDDDIADGFTEVGTITSKDFTNSLQRIDGSAGSIALQFIFRLPLAGVKIINSFESVSGSIYTDDFRITVRDSVESIVNTVTKEVLTNDRISSSIITGSGAYSLLLQYLRTNSIASAIYTEGKEPALRVDGSAEYIAG